MKTIKAIIVAVLISTIAIPAFADNQLIDSIIGAVAGGGAGRALCRNCNTRSRNVATGVGALAGTWVGSTVGDDSGTRFQQQQQQQRQIADERLSLAQQRIDQTNRMYEANHGYAGGVTTLQANQVRTVQPIIVNSDVDPRDGSEAIVEPIVVAPRHVVRAAAMECDEQYYHGVYDPDSAYAYCKGRRDSQARREQAIRDAYAEGLAAR